MKEDDGTIYFYKIISIDRKFIYGEYPKAASTSIKKIILPHLVNNRIKRLRLKLLVSKNRVGDLQWRRIIPECHLKENICEYSDFFRFSIVRNPFEKTVSNYKMFQKRYKGKKHDASGESFNEFVHSLLEKRRVKNLKDKSLNHLLPWTSLFNVEDFDYISHMETLDKDWKKIKREIGIKKDLPYLNKTKHKPYQKYYDDETREIIYNIYKKDFETFDYTW